MKSVILTICGSVALALGAIGLLLPVMPTTPFVLVAAACFGGSNKRMYDKLSGSKYFGEFIENYREKTGINVSVKRTSIAFLWAMLTISAFLSNTMWVTLILLSVGTAVTVHILMIKSRQ